MESSWKEVLTYGRVVSVDELFSMIINGLRGNIGSYGSIVFEVYSGQFKADFDPTATGLNGIKVKPSTKVLTFSNFQRRTRARYSRHELINKKSVLEKVGDEPDTISLDIKLIKDLGVVPEEQVELIRSYIKAGHEDVLIIGSEVLGTFTITDVTESRQYVDCFGRTQVMELSLTFEETDDANGNNTTTNDFQFSPLIWL